MVSGNLEARYVAGCLKNNTNNTGIKERNHELQHHLIWQYNTTLVLASSCMSYDVKNNIWDQK